MFIKKNILALNTISLRMIQFLHVFNVISEKTILKYLIHTIRIQRD